MVLARPSSHGDGSSPVDPSFAPIFGTGSIGSELGRECAFVTVRVVEPGRTMVTMEAALAWRVFRHEGLGHVANVHGRVAGNM